MPGKNLKELKSFRLPAVSRNVGRPVGQRTGQAKCRPCFRSTLLVPKEAARHQKHRAGQPQMCHVPVHHRSGFRMGPALRRPKSMEFSVNEPLS